LDESPTPRLSADQLAEPTTIVDYASRSPSPTTTQHSLSGYPLRHFPGRSFTGWNSPAFLAHHKLCYGALREQCALMRIACSRKTRLGLAQSGTPCWIGGPVRRTNARKTIHYVHSMVALTGTAPLFAHCASASLRICRRTVLPIVNIAHKRKTRAIPIRSEQVITLRKTGHALCLGHGQTIMLKRGNGSHTKPSSGSACSTQALPLRLRTQDEPEPPLRSPHQCEII
jgi:hypothetical protein